MKIEVQDFFNLPLEEKKKFWQYPGEIEGFGQAFVVSEEQKLDWGDLFFLVTQPIHLRKPHLFPKIPLPFRSPLFLLAYIHLVLQVLGGPFQLILFLKEPSFSMQRHLGELLIGSEKSSHSYP